MHSKSDSGNDTVTGNAGNAVVYKWKSGNLTYDGGASVDTLDFNPATFTTFPTAFAQRLVVNLASGVGKNPYGGYLKLSNVENVYGTPQADTIVGSDAANVIGDPGATDFAGALIDARCGNDTANFFSFAGVLAGVAGATVNGGAGSDTLFCDYDFRGNVLDLLVQSNNAGMFLGSVFSNFERFILQACNATDLAFRGDANANDLTVLLGRLSINMSAGNDTLRLTSQSAGESIFATGGTGNDRLLFNPHAGRNILDLEHPKQNSGSFADGRFSGFEIFTLDRLSGFQYALDFRGDGSPTRFSAAISPTCGAAGAATTGFRPRVATICSMAGLAATY